MAANQLLGNEQVDITGKANDVLSSYSTEMPTGELLIKILEDNNINLSEIDLMETSGVLFKDENNNWNLIVNQCDSYVRKLFTIAHELGHYFLHRNESDEFIDGALAHNRTEETRFQNFEIQANEFAGNLLMPETKITALVGPQRIITLEKVRELSKTFSVSTFAIQTRLRNLDYEFE